MIKACFMKNKASGFHHFSLSGHSGYASAGNDIVCAAVSSAADLVLSILCDDFHVDAKVNVSPEKAGLECTILETENNSKKRDMISGVLNGFYRHILDMEKQYPKYISCTLTEV